MKHFINGVLKGPLCIHYTLYNISCDTIIYLLFYKTINMMRVTIPIVNKRLYLTR